MLAWSNCNYIYSKSIEMNVYNFIQINETEFRFDVRVRNTTPNPETTGAIGIHGWSIYLNFNPAIKNGSYLVNDYVGNTDMVGLFNIPLSYQYNNTDNYFQSFSNAADINKIVTYLNTAAWYRIGTFKFQCRIADDSGSSLKNLGSFNPSVVFKTIGNQSGLNECNVRAELNDDDEPTGNWVVADANFLPVACTKTLSLTNEPLYSHLFTSTGTGDYSNELNWNKRAVVGRNIKPINGSNASIGGYSTANPPSPNTGDCSQDENASVNYMYLNANSKLTLESGQSLTVDTFNIRSTSLGNGTFVDANTNGGLTLGTANVEQYMTSGRNWYISSPIVATTTAALSTASSVSHFNEGIRVDGYSGSLTPGKGYISVNNNATGIVTFTGKLNNTVSIPVSRTHDAYKEGFNLIGNPYPSHLAWTLDVASAANLLPSMWYRTTSGGNIYTFPTFNALGSVGSPAGTSQEIAPMQSFWVRVKSSSTLGTVTFTNAMRLHKNNNMLKAPASSDNNNTLVRLQVNNGVNSDEMVIYTNPDASNAYDDYDSPKWLNGTSSVTPDIYTTVSTENLIINGLKQLPLDTEIPLTFAANNAQVNNFTIQANEISNLPTGVKLILVDNGVETDLTNGVTSYSFSSNAGTTKTLGVIFRSTGAVTGFINGNKNDVTIYSKEHNRIVIQVNGKLNENTKVGVYNAVGQKISDLNLTSTNAVIDVDVPGIYLVSVNNFTQKVIVK